MWDRPQHVRPHSLQVSICCEIFWYQVFLNAELQKLRKETVICLGRWHSAECGVRSCSRGFKLFLVLLICHAGNHIIMELYSCILLQFTFSFLSSGVTMRFAMF
jgi:hypothetical protein